MRVLQEHKYDAILTAARAEFIAKGFKDASMRDIARKADVGLSNIYNYFGSKDELFTIVVKPAKEELFTFITRNHQEESIDVDRSTTFGHHDESIDYYIGLVENYKEELRLLLYRSEGSSLGDFRNMLTDHITQVSYTYMALEKKHFPESRDISPFFIHTLASWMVSVLGEIVTHDLSPQKIREFFLEYFRFEFAGWRELTGT